MIWLAVFLAVTLVVYLFSVWQVNRTVRDYYRLKAEWDLEWAKRDDDNAAFLAKLSAHRDGPIAGGSMES